jgi:TonB family protein
MLKRDDLFPYLIISIFFHIVIYFLVRSKENPVFLPSLIEVSFYSLSSQKAEQLSAAASSKKTGVVTVSAWEQIKSNDTKEGIIVKKKKSPGKKVDGLKPEAKLKVQIETDTKKYDKQSAKPIGEKKAEVAEFLGNGSSVETFQTTDTDKLFVGAGSQYEGLSFDTKNFKYYSYYSEQIIRKIRGQWRLDKNYGKLRALVYFKIYRNGTISDIFVKESSKNSEYDKYALDTVRRAVPFSDLPDGYEGDSLGVFFEFKKGN